MVVAAYGFGQGASLPQLHALCKRERRSSSSSSSRDGYDAQVRISSVMAASRTPSHVQLLAMQY